LEATRDIRHGDGPCRSVPIVAMTANAFPEDVAACRAAGMDDFVAKPISRQILIGAILRAIPDEDGVPEDANTANPGPTMAEAAAPEMAVPEVASPLPG
jgi:DNA-binding response OmpR family regulator